MTWTSRRAIPVFLTAATLIPVAVVVWLAVRVLQQDHQDDARRRQEMLRGAAAQVALGIERSLADVEEQLARGQGTRFAADGLSAVGDAAPLYQPVRPPARAVEPSVFADVEELELRQNDLVAAASGYRRLAESRDASVRAAALVRLGAVLRRQHDFAGALKAYDQLERDGSVDVDGQPAALIARQGRARVYEQSGDRERLQRESGELARTLSQGTATGAAIDRGTFQLYRDLLEAWGAALPRHEAEARTDAAIALWHAWRAGELPARGRRTLRMDGIPILAIWTGGPDTVAVRLLTAADIDASIAPLWTRAHLTGALYDLDGERMLGSEQQDSVTLAPTETRLPFTLQLAFGPDWPADDQDAARRRVLIVGLAFAVVLMLAAAYGLSRATAREVALARQQSDFVAAVSHEFRTPLTSLRHLSELLAGGRVRDDARRSLYYMLLARETERLHRIVESLLNVSRMQAGAYAWKLESVDAAGLVDDVVEEFRREPRADRERQVSCDIDTHLPPIHADREALARAISNLLENADKYSEAGSPIRVLARHANHAVEISVEDRGIGIPPDEQKRLFQRFVRGADATRAGIRGLGVGLALVKSVAEAHGGSVQVVSQPGLGSTFTISLPESGHVEASHP